jgi:hypothetical protein
MITTNVLILMRRIVPESGEFGQSALRRYRFLYRNVTVVSSPSTSGLTN